MKHQSILMLATASAALLAGPAFAQTRGTTGAPTRPVTTPAPDRSPMVRPQAPTPAVPTYQLGPGDKLNIVVNKDAQLTGPVQIRPDGKITMALIGDIEASGKTPGELRDAITLALKEYVNNPVVTVVVVEATAAVAYVVGGVNNAGAIPIHNSLTVLQALALAGGLNEWAKSKDIRILRKGPSGMQTIKFNYKDAINGEGPPVYLRANDTIVVPE